jgi:serine O-acetyltransferase
MSTAPTAIPPTTADPATAAAQRSVGDSSRDAGWFRSIYLDYRRARATDESWYEVIFLTQGFWACCAYRTARASIRLADRVPVARAVVRAFWAVAGLVVGRITGVHLHPDSDIGPGLYVGHFGNVVIDRGARLGRNCNIGQGVNVLAAGHGAARVAPRLGDRVFVGANGVVEGDVTVGDDAVIGACAYVNKPVPPRGVVLGNPARVIGYHGSFDNIRYDGMDHDPARIAALQAAPAPGATGGGV